MKLLFIYLQLLLNPPEFDTFIANFSAKEYVMVRKFHQLPVQFRHSMKEIRKLKFIEPENYNQTDVAYRYRINNSRRRGTIYFAYSVHSAIIYYTHGGRATHEHLYIVGIDANKKTWHRNLIPIRHKNLIELQQIQKNKDYSEAIEGEI